MAETVRQHDWWKTAIVTVLAIELLGGASGRLSNSGYGNDWFDALQKPAFMPPGWAVDDGTGWKEAQLSVLNRPRVHMLVIPVVRRNEYSSLAPRALCWCAQ